MPWRAMHSGAPVMRRCSSTQAPPRVTFESVKFRKNLNSCGTDLADEKNKRNGDFVLIYIFRSIKIKKTIVILIFVLFLYTVEILLL